MSDYKKLKMGICDKCDGNIQFDKENSYYYCMDCHKIWNEADWDYYMMLMKEEEYHTPEYEENISNINSNKFWNYKYD